MPALDALRQRKIGQWTVAYAAAAWGALQLLDFLASHFAWPGWIVRAATVFLIINVLAVIILAWYHGEKGPQRATPLEALLLGLTLLAALGGGWLGARSRGGTDSHATSSQPAISESSIAVLPFENHGAADNAYFSDGITEEILNAVARIPGLRVAARTSSFAFRGDSGTTRDIAERLGVAHLLSGSVQRSGDRVRVTSQLVVAAKDSTLWSQTFDGTANDLFALEDSISRAIATQLQKNIAPLNPRAAAASVNDSAHMLYYLGRDRWAHRTVPSIVEAIDLFTRSINAAPDWAPAHAGLALALSVYPNYARDMSDDTIFARGESEARRALQLDPESDEAYAALSQIAQYRGDMRHAEQYARKAIELNPNNATAHQWLAEVVGLTGRFDESMDEINRALVLDRLSAVMLSFRAVLYRAVGQTDKSIQDAYASLRIDSTFDGSITGALQAALEAKRYDVARDMLRRMLPDRPDGVEVVINAFQGNVDAKRAVLRQLKDDVPGLFIAELLGDRDRAISILQQADRRRIPAYYFYAAVCTPGMKGLREDPRYPKRYAWPVKI